MNGNSVSSSASLHTQPCASFKKGKKILFLLILCFHSTFIPSVLLWFLFCLFSPCRGRQSLKVREHKVLGPYVDGLSQLAVTCFEVCLFTHSVLRGQSAPVVLRFRAAQTTLFIAGEAAEMHLLH